MRDCLEIQRMDRLLYKTIQTPYQVLPYHLINKITMIVLLSMSPGSWLYLFEWLIFFVSKHLHGIMDLTYVGEINNSNSMLKSYNWDHYSVWSSLLAHPACNRALNRLTDTSDWWLLSNQWDVNKCCDNVVSGIIFSCSWLSWWLIEVLAVLSKVKNWEY